MRPLQNKKIAIVGAGLVGPLCSLFLAKRGIPSTLIERRGDLRKEKVSAGRSINLAISTRGLHALKQLDLDQQALALAIPMYGRLIHKPSGETAFQRYSAQESECIYSISRSGLSAMLLSAAEATGNVELCFHQNLELVDLTSATLSFRDPRDGLLKVKSFDHVIGADGSASLLRNEILNKTEGACRLDRTQHSYKELVMPARSDGQPAIERNALHIWPRGSHMLIALPNLDGSFTCTLFLKTSADSEHDGPTFESLQTPAQVRTFFESQFPDAACLLPNLEEEFFSHPTGAMLTVRSFPWNYSDKALLIGDAAHAILPFYGQGMNCGFEDCVALDDLLGRVLSEKEPNISEVFAQFGSLRKPQSDAIADMAIENFIEMSDKVGKASFLLEKSVEKLLQDHFPGQFISRYSIVTFSNLPYQLALRVGNVTHEILLDLCADISQPQDVDLQRAKILIQKKLRPVLEEFSATTK